jgi:hypothetical protein
MQGEDSIVSSGMETWSCMSSCAFSSELARQGRTRGSLIQKLKSQ